MGAPRCSDSEFIRLFESAGPAEAAKILKTDIRAIHSRRRRLEGLHGTTIRSPIGRGGVILQERTAPGRAEIRVDLTGGIVVIGSDAHYWPGMISTAHAGMVRMCEELKPAIVIQNGDVVDGATLSRFPSGSWSDWENKPPFADELEACQKRLAEIEAASPGARRLWPAGNHDLRFEARIANTLPELAGVHGTHLKDFFPHWEPCWRSRIGNTMIKHRFRSGIHAGMNNALWSGMSIVTGHLHKGIVYPLTDYTGTRYGVDMPTLAEPAGRQFVDYTEAGPTNWRSGFAVLTWLDGTMCQPELAFVHDVGVIEFRGRRFKV